jgi:uncharacterized protein (TIGR02117 family)
VIALGLAAIAAATVRPGDPRLFPPRPCAPHVIVFLTRNSYHAELALPVPWLRAQGGAAAEALDRLRPSPWVLVGWGDSRFFRQAGWSAERIRDALRALGPDNPSAIRLTPLNRAPDLAFRSGVLRIDLSQAGARRLMERLDRSFRIEGRRPLQIPTLQPSDQAAYFASVERFSIAKTCNEWTGQILNAAGLATTPMLDATPQGLMWEVRGQTGGQAVCREPRRR